MKILMVGLGSIGQRHLRNLKTIFNDNVVLSAFRQRKDQTVISPTLEVENGENLDTKYGYTVYEDLDLALDNSPDAVFICNPSSMHMEVALKAARQGCHLFIEKPLSNNLEHIDELKKIVTEKKLTVLVGFQLRFHPCYLKLKELLENHSIGNLLSVRIEVGEYLPGWHKWEDYRLMYASRRELGGGVVYTQIHEIDYALSLFGYPKKLYAVGGHLSNLELNGVEDTASVLMECCYDDKKLPVSINMDYLQRPPSRNCKIVGDNGTIVMDLTHSSVSVVDINGRIEKSDFRDLDRNQLFIDEIKHFFKCIDGKETPVVNIETAEQGIKIGSKILESMEKEVAVSLN